MMWTHITDLGDAAVMVPAGLGIAAWLLLSRAYHDALVWLVLFGVGAFLVVCSKIAYMGWGIGVPQLDFTGISGHSMTATSVLAVAGYFVGSRLSRLGALVAAALGYAVGILVGVSRIMVGAHSLTEVVAGCALGGDQQADRGARVPQLAQLGEGSIGHRCHKEPSAPKGRGRPW